MKVACLIPAWNEERTVAQVVRTCLVCPLVEEVVVISDGSTDGTAQEALQAGARLIIRERNGGKDRALQDGLEATEAGLLVLIDADLLGLRPEHISALIEPVLAGRAQTTLGVFRHGGWQTDLSQNLTPFLNGQRCLTKQLWLDAITPYLGVGYGLETVLSRYIHRHGIRLERVTLEGVGQLRKEQKLGWWQGLLWRMRMYREIFAALGMRLPPLSPRKPGESPGDSMSGRPPII
jgi:glycosyltransferase involved in cell wall biosynthesis